VTPTVIHAAGKRNVHKGPPLGALRFLQQLHPCLVGETIAFSCVAWNARTDNILPVGLTSTILGQYMVDVQAAAVKDDSAVLACVLVPLEDIVAGELHFFLGQSVKKAKHDNSGHTDL